MNLEQLIIFCLIMYSGWYGWKQAGKKIQATRKGELPGYNSKDNQSYFFFIDYD
tara:strand:+ start:401 stop:562 length:162 start_codon:yes stop_codon:yes gene_type:complete